MSQTVVNFDLPIADQQARWQTGEVIDQDGALLSVSVEGEKHIHPARRAFSCLMEPMPGDLVCLMFSETGVLYVTNILERQLSESGSRAEATLHFSGQLSLKADAGLALETGDKLKIRAKKLEGAVSEVNWVSRLAQITSKEILMVTGLARLTCKVRELFAGHFQMSADNSYRNITKTDNVRAGVYNLRADSLASIRAPCAIIKANKLAKIDSSQVHIG